MKQQSAFYPYNSIHDELMYLCKFYIPKMTLSNSPLCTTKQYSKHCSSRNFWFVFIFSITEQCATQVSLDKIQNCEKWLVDQMVVSPVRGTLTSWRNEKTRTLKFNKGNAKVCTWVMKNPIHQHRLGLTSWKAALQRKTASQWEKNMDLLEGVQ